MQIAEAHRFNIENNRITYQVLCNTDGSDDPHWMDAQYVPSFAPQLLFNPILCLSDSPFENWNILGTELEAVGIPLDVFGQMIQSLVNGTYFQLEFNVDFTEVNGNLENIQVSNLRIRRKEVS